MNERGEVEWIPPPALDTGQTRINTNHRPERLLRPPDQEPPCSPDAGLQSDGGAAETTPSGHHDQPGETQCGDNQPINDEPISYELTDDAQIDYELTEPSASNNPGETEEPDEPCEPGEPGDPDKPDKSRGPDQPGGPAPPDGQAA